MKTLTTRQEIIHYLKAQGYTQEEMKMFKDTLEMDIVVAKTGQERIGEINEFTPTKDTSDLDRMMKPQGNTVKTDGLTPFDYFKQFSLFISEVSQYRQDETLKKNNFQRFHNMAKADMMNIEEYADKYLTDTTIISKIKRQTQSVLSLINKQIPK